MAEKIAPCPFCGKAVNHVGAFAPEFWLQCECGYSSPAHGDDEHVYRDHNRAAAKLALADAVLAVAAEHVRVGAENLDELQTFAFDMLLAVEAYRAATGEEPR